MVLKQQEAGGPHAVGNVNFPDGQLSRLDAAGSNPSPAPSFQYLTENFSIREAGDPRNRRGSNPEGFKSSASV